MSDMLQLVVRDGQHSMYDETGSIMLECCPSRRQAEACRTFEQHSMYDETGSIMLECCLSRRQAEACRTFRVVSMFDCSQKTCSRKQEVDGLFTATSDS